MIHNLERNTKNTYIYRVYERFGTLRYIFSMPVSYRGKGEFEAHAWNSVKKLCSSVSLFNFADGLRWIHSELKRIDKRFKCLTGTFECDRLKAYHRLFNSITIVVLRQTKKSYNGVLAKFCIVRFDF